MSMLFTLRRYIDPVVVGTEEAEKRVEQQRPRDEQPGAPPRPPRRTRGAYACRVCGREGADDGYCPTCLADTMRPRSRGA